MTADLFHPLHSHGIGDSSLFTSRPFEKSPIRIICRVELLSRGQRTFKGKGAAFELKMQKKKKRSAARPDRSAEDGMEFSVFCYFLQEDPIVFLSDFTLTVPCPSREAVFGANKQCIHSIPTEILQPQYYSYLLPPVF